MKKKFKSKLFGLIKIIEYERPVASYNNVEHAETRKIQDTNAIINASNKFNIYIKKIPYYNTKFFEIFQNKNKN